MAGVPANPLAATSARYAPAPKVATIKNIGIDGLRALKAQAPNAANMTDAEFALAAHEHAYSDVPLVDFLKAVGLDRGDVLYETRKPGNVYGDYSRKALSTKGGGETDAQAAKRYGGAIDTRRAGGLEGTGRALLQGATFGAGDEIVAGGAALLDPLVNGDRGKDFGQRFNAYMGREQGLVQDFREDNPALAYGAEIAGAIPTSIMASAPAMAVRAGGFGRAAVGTADAALQGAAYGFMGTDGGLEERSTGAGIGAGLGIGGNALGTLLGAGTRKLISSSAQKAATRQNVQAAPTAAALAKTSKAAFKASENTGAKISAQSLGTLSGRVRQLATDEGLLLPSGGITDGYSKAAGVLRMIDEYAKGDISMKQAQSLLKTARGVAKTGGSEGEFGRKLVKEIMDHFDSMRPTDFTISPTNQAGAPFTNGAGPEAVQQWRQGMSLWALAKRADTVEKIIHKAQWAKGGNVAEGLRSGFRKVLMNERRQMGFSPAELKAIEAFVKGGSVDNFMAFIQRGSAFPMAIGAHLAGGPFVGAAAGLARAGVGAGAGALRNKGAQEAADIIRASVAAGRSPKAPPVPPRPLPAFLGAAGRSAAQQTREPLQITIGGRR
jgi:hypothetical protein